MLERKHKATNDVPMPIVIALVAVLLALFAPYVLLLPALPAALPALSLDVRATLAAQQSARRVEPTAQIRQSFYTLAEAHAARDGRRALLAQRDFSWAVIESGGADNATVLAMREGAREAFVRDASRGVRNALVDTAARHRLFEPGRPLDERQRAQLGAWFAFRWEAMSGRHTLRGERDPLERIAARMSATDRRALVAWVLSSECPALLGAPASPPLGADAVVRCARTRDEYVGLARLIEGSYPVDLARATVKVLEGRALSIAARAQRDPSARGTMQGEARDAYGEAHRIFLGLAERDRSRTLRRYLLGTSQGMGSE